MFSRARTSLLAEVHVHVSSIKVTDTLSKPKLKVWCIQARWKLMCQYGWCTKIIDTDDGIIRLASTGEYLNSHHIGRCRMRLTMVLITLQNGVFFEHKKACFFFRIADGAHHGVLFHVIGMDDLRSSCRNTFWRMRSRKVKHYVHERLLTSEL